MVTIALKFAHVNELNYGKKEMKLTIERCTARHV